MKHFWYLSLLLVVFLFAVTGCNEEGVVYPKAGEPYVLINNTNQPLELAPAEASLNFVGLEEVLEEVRQNAAQKQISLSVSAWEYVLENTTYFVPLGEELWYGAPQYMLNSTRFGWCSSRATLLANILTALEQPSRLWFLEGHAVAETLVDGQWQVYDADQGVYFTDSSGRVLSYENLCQPLMGTVKINYYSNKVTPLYLLHYGGSDTLVAGGYIHNLYRTTEDNLLDDNATVPAAVPNLVLPSYSSLYYLVYDSLKHPIVKRVVAVKLSPGSSGEFVMPLVPIGVSGKARISLSEGITHSFEGTLVPVAATLLFGYSGHIRLDTVKDTTTVYFLANGVGMLNGYEPSIGEPKDWRSLYASVDKAFAFSLANKIYTEALSPEKADKLKDILLFLQNEGSTARYWDERAFVEVSQKYGLLSNLPEDERASFQANSLKMHQKIRDFVPDTSNAVWKPENISLLLLFAMDSAIVSAL